jgi:hypothetical protein
MQLLHVLVAWIGKEGENRESLIRLTQDANRSNGKRSPDLATPFSLRA